MTIGEKVASIGYNAFAGCTALTAVALPVSLAPNADKNDYSIFAGCTALTTLTVAAGNTSFYAEDNLLYTKNPKALVLCPPGLTSATVADGVTKLNNRAFENCTKLTSAVIPDSVTEFGVSVFTNCSALKSLNIPAGVTKYYASTGCTALTGFTVAAGNTAYCAENGVLYTKDMKTLVQCPATFTSVTIPASITAIGRDAFTDCAGLTSIAVPDKVVTIGEYAFRQCTGLKTLTLGEAVTNISNNITMNCTSLTAFVVADGNAKYCAEGGVLYTEDMKALVKCPAGLTSVTIADGITEIYGEAFDHAALTEVIIPDTVTSIGARAFYYCAELKAVTIPASVTFMGNSVFSKSFYDADGNELSGVASIAGHSYRLDTVGAMKVAGFVLYEGNTVTVTATVGGSATGAGLYDVGKAVTITATAADGYTFAGWYDGDTKVTDNASYTFTPTGNVTYTAHFSANATPGGGDGSSDGGSGDGGSSDGGSSDGGNGSSNTWIWIVVVIVVVLVVLLAVYFLFIRTGKLKL